MLFMQYLGGIYFKKPPCRRQDDAWHNRIQKTGKSGRKKPRKADNKSSVPHSLSASEGWIYYSGSCPVGLYGFHKRRCVFTARRDIEKGSTPLRRCGKRLCLKKYSPPPYAFIKNTFHPVWAPIAVFIPPAPNMP